MMIPDPEIDGGGSEGRGSVGTSLEGVHLLLVEDSWHIAIATKSVLENAGLDVAGPAANADRALALLDTAVPEVALVDMNLQGKLAHGLIDRLTRDGVSVIVVSGYQVGEELSGRVAAVMSKPVRAPDLIATLRSVVAQRRRKAN